MTREQLLEEALQKVLAICLTAPSDLTARTEAGRVAHAALLDRRDGKFLGPRVRFETGYTSPPTS